MSDRESQLRSIRREIGVAEAEKEAMQRTIEKMQANNVALETQAAHGNALLSLALITSELIVSPL